MQWFELSFKLLRSKGLNWFDLIVISELLTPMQYLHSDGNNRLLLCKHIGHINTSSLNLINTFWRASIDDQMLPLLFVITIAHIIHKWLTFVRNLINLSGEHKRWPILLFSKSNSIDKISDLDPNWTEKFYSWNCWTSIWGWLNMEPKFNEAMQIKLHGQFVKSNRRNITELLLRSSN